MNKAQKEHAELLATTTALLGKHAAILEYAF